MIGTERNIKGYIGGSDAVRVHGGWETDTFKRFWRERLTGIRESDSFDSIHTSAGNVMESEILEAVGVDRKYWNTFFEPKETIAGINTDAFEPNIYHEVKTVLWEAGAKWIIGGAISANYIYQVQHGMFVTGAEEARLHVCLMTEAEKYNPFSVQDVSSRIHTFKFNRMYFDTTKVTLAMYGALIRHLTDCYRKGVFPTDKQKKEIINSFS